MRTRGLLAGLMWVLTVVGAWASPANAIAIDVPELVGDYVYGQDPVQAEVDFGIDFQPLWRIYIEIEAMLVPSLEVPGVTAADLIVSAQGSTGLQWFDGTTLGPYGVTPVTRSAENSFVWIAIWPPPITSGRGIVTLMAPNTWEGDGNAPIVRVLSTRLIAGDYNSFWGCGIDVNCDGFVGISELNLVLGHWNQYVTPGDMLSGDADGDGYVGIADLNAVLSEWNAGTPPPPVMSDITVPEPATVAVLGLAMVAVNLRRRG